MNKVIMTIGLQASGKSTWAKEQATLYSDKVRRVNKDDIRNLLGIINWSYDEEKRVQKIQYELLRTFIKDGFNVIVDNIHLSSSSRKDLMKDIKQISIEFDKEIKVESKYFPISLENALERNKNRGYTVSNEVIVNTFHKYNWNEIVSININKIITPGCDRDDYLTDIYHNNSNLPHAIICDIDGTIAKMTGRNPFEWHSVGEDEPKQNIIDIVNVYYTLGINIIVLSGRDGSCKSETELWLKKNGVLYHDLFMRAPNDNRNDAIIKKELFDTHIRNKYHIRFILDDRDRVVDMWRNVLGLTCLQVNYGNF